MAGMSSSQVTKRCARAVSPRAPQLIHETPKKARRKLLNNYLVNSIHYMKRLSILICNGGKGSKHEIQQTLYGSLAVSLRRQ